MLRWQTLIEDGEVETQRCERFGLKECCVTQTVNGMLMAPLHTAMCQGSLCRASILRGKIMQVSNLRQAHAAQVIRGALWGADAVLCLHPRMKTEVPPSASWGLSA